ncbi:O-acetyl-ADP-ribose deacetylase [Marinigracilibium pacificum]|uniref:O-acetyl-ADP-ribose deacetylase n=1 Tax=Marinigracilibium pacificum TaxID=2729599 RepID=A0A848J4F8_9BACT|nr:O-acetyl-ADP-ribose deacetylase [Marinigracilibium pacificum]NMM50188.1 O-acetyl-ADP-ribose deacetylase [Marinigracilibium pacificum]
MLKITLIKDDITTLDVDAIVNAANNSLLGGGGVDGAIHRAAGPELLKATKRLKGCETGHSKATPGFQLPAEFIIHTVGPVWQGGNHNEENLLRSAYLSSLEIADKNNCSVIAFPNISTGVYGFPKQRAAEIALTSVGEFDPVNLKEVIFCCFDDENLKIYSELLNV